MNEQNSNSERALAIGRFLHSLIGGLPIGLSGNMPGQPEPQVFAIDGAGVPKIIVMIRPSVGISEIPMHFEVPTHFELVDPAEEDGADEDALVKGQCEQGCPICGGCELLFELEELRERYVRQADLHDEIEDLTQQLGVANIKLRRMEATALAPTAMSHAEIVAMFKNTLDRVIGERTTAPRQDFPPVKNADYEKLVHDLNLAVGALKLISKQCPSWTSCTNSASEALRMLGID